MDVGALIRFRQIDRHFRAFDEFLWPLQPLIELVVVPFEIRLGQARRVNRSRPVYPRRDQTTRTDSARPCWARPF